VVSPVSKGPSEGAKTSYAGDGTQVVRILGLEGGRSHQLGFNDTHEGDRKFPRNVKVNKSNLPSSTGEVGILPMVISKFFMGRGGLLRKYRDRHHGRPPEGGKKKKKSMVGVKKRLKTGLRRRLVSVTSTMEQEIVPGCLEKTTFRVRGYRRVRERGGTLGAKNRGPNPVALQGVYEVRKFGGGAN